jgi:hypothetical protein
MTRGGDGQDGYAGKMGDVPIFPVFRHARFFDDFLVRSPKVRIYAASLVAIVS